MRKWRITVWEDYVQKDSDGLMKRFKESLEAKLPFPNEDIPWPYVNIRIESIPEKD